MNEQIPKKKAYLIVAFDLIDEELKFSHTFICGDRSPTQNMRQLYTVALESPECFRARECSEWILSYAKRMGTLIPVWKFLYDKLDKNEKTSKILEAK